MVAPHVNFHDYKKYLPLNIKGEEQEISRDHNYERTRCSGPRIAGNKVMF